MALDKYFPWCAMKDSLDNPYLDARHDIHFGFSVSPDSRSLPKTPNVLVQPSLLTSMLHLHHDSICGETSSDTDNNGQEGPRKHPRIASVFEDSCFISSRSRPVPIPPSMNPTHYRQVSCARAALNQMLSKY